MKNLRILARTLVVQDSEILLVRNKDADFWYPPGGGWEYETETITECAVREVKEETGYIVDIEKLLWMQEFHEGEKIFFETFWLSKISGLNTQTPEQVKHHIDLDPEGAVAEAKWFTKEEVESLKVFPKRIKSFSTMIDDQKHSIDPFIGTFL